MSLFDVFAMIAPFALLVALVVATITAAIKDREEIGPIVVLFLAIFFLFSFVGSCWHFKETKGDKVFFVEQPGVTQAKGG